jgi:hypothetical protein
MSRHLERNLGHVLRRGLSKPRLPLQWPHRAVHFRSCASYIEYIEHTTGGNASATQQNPLAGYIKDTLQGTGDKCRTAAP